MQTDDWRTFVTPEDEAAALLVEQAVVELCRLRARTLPPLTEEARERLIGQLQAALRA